MRRLSYVAVALAAFTVSAPAMAQDASAADPATSTSAAAAIAQMSDPATQLQVAMMAQAMGEILMDMPVAPLLNAVGQMAGEDVAPDVDPDARVADLIGEDARGIPAQMAERIPAMMGAMASLAGALEQLAPQFRDLAARLPRPAATNQ